MPIVPKNPRANVFKEPNSKPIRAIIPNPGLKASRKDFPKPEKTVENAAKNPDSEIVSIISLRIKRDALTPVPAAILAAETIPPAASVAIMAFMTTRFCLFTFSIALLCASALRRPFTSAS